MDLKTWMSAPRGRSNLIGLATNALLMVSLFVVDYDPAERLALVRRTATFMIIAHAIFHGMSVFALRSMIQRGVENADLALSFYLHPRRISNMDLAMAWIGLFAVAPYLT